VTHEMRQSSIRSAVAHYFRGLIPWANLVC